MDFFKLEAGRALDLVRAPVRLSELVADVHCIIEAMLGGRSANGMSATSAGAGGGAGGGSGGGGGGVALAEPDLEGVSQVRRGDMGGRRRRRPSPCMLRSCLLVPIGATLLLLARNLTQTLAPSLHTL